MLERIEVKNSFKKKLLPVQPKMKSPLALQELLSLTSCKRCPHKNSKEIHISGCVVFTKVSFY